MILRPKAILNKLLFRKKAASQTKGLYGCLFLLSGIFFQTAPAKAQAQQGGFPELPPDNSQIHSVVFSQQDKFNQAPIVKLGETGTWQLSFDDFDVHPKVYNYTLVRRDENWAPVLMSTFDYLKGFGQGRITQYNYSSFARQKYIHYAIDLPSQECLPIQSGNYLLKVYEAGDTSKLAFCRRLLVVDNKVAVSAIVKQPMNSQYTGDFQKLDLSVDLSRLQVQNPMQQVKVVVLQNFRWDNAIHHLQPTFIRGSNYEYNGEQSLLFEPGKEYRWIDLRSFRFQSERIESIDLETQPYKVTAKTDISRRDIQYLPYEDHNGSFQITATESINPAWQGDYGWVRFSYRPRSSPAPNDLSPGQQAIYLLGQFNQYRCTPESRLKYDPAKGQYEIALLLKQGYYDYLYAAETPAGPAGATMPKISIKETEGNYWETENDYTVLVYYQSLSDRAPQLVGVTTVNSRKK